MQPRCQRLDPTLQLHDAQRGQVQPHQMHSMRERVYLVAVKRFAGRPIAERRETDQHAAADHRQRPGAFDVGRGAAMQRQGLAIGA